MGGKDGRSDAWNGAVFCTEEGICVYACIKQWSRIGASRPGTSRANPALVQDFSMVYT